MVVLEARDRVGGPLLNEDIGDGKVVEVGGQWIGPTQDRLAALARELGVETFPTHDEGENVIEYGGQAAPLPGRDPAHQPARAARRRSARSGGSTGSPAACRPRRPGRHPNARRLDGADRRDLAAPQPRAPRRARSCCELGIEAVWAAEPEDMSLLHVLFYIRSAGWLELLIDTEGGAQQDRFVGGSQLRPDPDGRGARRERVVLGAPVRRISRGDRRGDVEADGVTCARGARSSRSRPRWPGRIAYDPPLPGYRDQLTQRMPLGTVAKCMAIYDEPFWRADGPVRAGAPATPARSS